MNPRDRRLRLRKSTVRNLNPEYSSWVLGGGTDQEICHGSDLAGKCLPEKNKNSEVLLCSLFCTWSCPSAQCNETRAWTNCEYC